MLIKSIYKKFKGRIRTRTELVPIAEPVYTDKLLAGRCALITGGSSGIGKAIAHAFLQAGANVIICGTTQEKLNRAVAELQDKNVKALQLDVKNVEQLPVKIKEALDLFPDTTIDILVNSAGLTQKVDMWDITEDLFDNIMNVNVKGMFFMSKFMSEYWIENGVKANILNISSSSALKPAWGPYQMSKWAVKGLTIGLASKLIKHKIIVNAIAPGKTATPMMCMDAKSDLNCMEQPIGRFESPQEIGNLAVCLVSSMGNVVIGDTLYATGGTGIL